MIRSMVLAAAWAGAKVGWTRHCQHMIRSCLGLGGHGSAGPFAHVQTATPWSCHWTKTKINRSLSSRSGFQASAMTPLWTPRRERVHDAAAARPVLVSSSPSWLAAYIDALPDSSSRLICYFVPLA